MPLVRHLCRSNTKLNLDLSHTVDYSLFIQIVQSNLAKMMQNLITAF